MSKNNVPNDSSVIAEKSAEIQQLIDAMQEIESMNPEKPYFVTIDEGIITALPKPPSPEFEDEGKIIIRDNGVIYILKEGEWKIASCGLNQALRWNHHTLPPTAATVNDLAEHIENSVLDYLESVWPEETALPALTAAAENLVRFAAARASAASDRTMEIPLLLETPPQPPPSIPFPMV